MTWEWSNAPEAYRDAELNLRDLPIETLIVIAAEWKAAYKDGYNYELSSPRYHRIWRKLTKDAYLGRITAEELADMIWPMAEELAECSNGGWEAYLCPFGCGCHQVPFDRAEDTDK